MAHYRVKVSTSDGVRTMDVDAADPHAAEAMCRRNGTVIEVRRERASIFKRGMSAGDRFTFMIRLSGMLSSRMPTDKALEQMASSFGGKIGTAAKDMLERIRAGMSHVEAMEFDRRNFPPALIALVRAGGAGKSTAEAMRGAAEFEIQMTRIKRTSTKDVWTAMFSFALAMGVMISTTEFFAPWVLDSSLFKQNKDIDVAWIKTAATISTWTIGVAFAGFFVLFVLGTVGRWIAPLFCEEAVIQIPYYRELVLGQDQYIAYYRFAKLVEFGVPVAEALYILVGSTRNGVIREDLKAALEAVNVGKEWAPAMTRLPATDRAALSFALDKKDVAQTLDVLASTTRDIYTSRVENFGPALNIVAAVAMGLSSIIMFGLTVMPMLQLSSSLSQTLQ